jgi:hypothetical protein
MVIMPLIVRMGMDNNEAEAATALQNALFQLALTAHEFEAAIALYWQSTSWSMHPQQPIDTDITRHWPFIAARVGALCLYDFFKNTQEINSKLLIHCPTIKPLVNMGAKKQAQRLLQKSFPGLIDNRNAAAHRGERNSTPEKAAANYARIEDVGLGTGGMINISGCLVNNKYIHTVEGKVVSYTVDASSVSQLFEALHLWKAAFTFKR